MWHPLWPDRPLARRPDHVGHERRAPADVDLRRARGAARRHRSAVRARAGDRRTRICGLRTGERSGGSSRTSRRRAARAELDPDVLTIGFARRFATYKRSSLLFTRPDRLAALLARSGAADPGARRREGAPGGRGGQGRDPAGPRLHAHAGGGGARRVPRGLRDDARAAARAGRRRLAQHAAPAVRGVGDVGDEGRAERRAQLLDPRRVVGRGRTRRRTGSRSARATRSGCWTTRSRTRSTPTRSSPCSRRT